MSTISIQTGTRANAGSDCRAVMIICDNTNKCCQTRTDGGGLDIEGRNDRESNLTLTLVQHYSTLAHGLVLFGKETLKHSCIY